MTVSATSSSPPKPPPRPEPAEPPAQATTKKAEEAAKSTASKAAEETAKAASQERAKVDPQVQTDTRQRVAAQEKQRIDNTQRVSETKPPVSTTPKRGLSPGGAPPPVSEPAPEPEPAMSPVETAAFQARQAESVQKQAEKVAAEKKATLAARDKALADAHLATADAGEAAAQAQAAHELGGRFAPTAQDVENAWKKLHAAADKVPAAEKNFETAKTERARADADVERAKVASETAHVKLADETRAATEKALATGDDAERQTIVDNLSRAGELAGERGAKTMGAAAALAIGESSGQPLATALMTSIENGNGALFGMRTAEAMFEQGPIAAKLAPNMVDHVAAGMATVQRQFDAAKEGVATQQAHFAEFMATHGKSLSPADRAAAEKEFKKSAAKEYEAYNEASKNLLSIAQGADAASETHKVEYTARRRVNLGQVRESVPAALMSEAGQAHLKDTLQTTPAGALPSHLVARSDAEAHSLAIPLAASVMGNPDAKGRSETLGDVAKHGEQLGMPELTDKALLAHYESAANGTSARGIKNALGAIETAVSAADKPSIPAAGTFGAMLGVTSGILNLNDAEGMYQVAEAATKLTHSATELAVDVFGGLAENPALSNRLTDKLAKAAAGLEKIADKLGKGAAGFDALNAIGSFAKGDIAEGAFSLASTAGAVLTFAGKKALGGWIGGIATVAEIGHDVHKSVKERKAYEAQATDVLVELGFERESAEILAGHHGDSSVPLERYGQGLGPGGSDLSATEVLERAQKLSPAEIRELLKPLPVNDGPYGVEWSEFVR